MEVKMDQVHKGELYRMTINHHTSRFSQELNLREATELVLSHLPIRLTLATHKLHF